MRKFLTEKRLFALLLVFAIMIGIVPMKSFAKNGVNEKEFLQMIKNDATYQKYEKALLSKKPILVNPAKDEDGNQIGYIAQYEVSYGYDTEAKKADKVKFTSVLTFIYNFDNDKLSSGVLDYSRIIDNKSVYYVDFSKNNEETAFPITSDDELQSYIDRAQAGYKDYEKEVNKQREAQAKKDKDLGSIQPLASQVCWVCTQYASDGGTYDHACEKMIGVSCPYLSKTIYGKLFCTAMLVVGCYIPKYQYCASGGWYTTCPIQS
ncbi:hypothetical protein E2K98_28750 [Bacillus salipaludis]|uniref:Uncharacterized protein n=1 Tax=Bacillus salipaludis TaxID=2547811 RepID=A0A4V3ASX1_9BACI|nr:hypothetical protein [Bacillus salipaludis]TDK54761.1 hypothetical protein E2K98_28750 [Bacillus salipaludis]